MVETVGRITTADLYQSRVDNGEITQAELDALVSEVESRIRDCFTSGACDGLSTTREVMACARIDASDSRDYGNWADWVGSVYSTIEGMW